jgi:tetratricopeptide (TPR) repeat protein
VYERATALGDRRLTARARSRLAGMGVLAEGADRDEIRAIEEENIQTFTEFGDEAGLAVAARHLGLACRVEGRVTEAIAWFERAVAHASACDDQSTRRTVTQSLAMILCDGPTPVGDAMRRCEELRDANRDDRVHEAVITRCLSALLAMAGRFDEARESGRSSSRVLDEANTLGASWLSQNYSSYAKELAGDRAGAERDMEARWLSYRDIKGGALSGSARSSANRLAYLYAGDGRWDDAEKYLALYRGQGKGGGATRISTEAMVAAHRGELGEAESLARRAVEIADRTPEWLNWRAEIWLAFAEVQRAAGRTAEADTAVATALELYEQKGNIAAATHLHAAVST